LQSLPRFFHTDLPEDLVAEIDAAKDEHVADIGIEWAIRQSEELLATDVPCLHFYIMSSARTVKRVVEPLRAMA
jgi:methylenetetrahydrofolate reductase (NADPH)